MFWFIAGIVVILIAVVSAVATKKPALFALILIGALLIVLSTLTTVPTQNVGVVTQFGKPTGRELRAGLHVKAPWQKVSDMDGTVQILDNVGADGRTTVRLNSNATMFVENSLRWRIKPDAASDLFLNYRSKDGDVVQKAISPNLVDKQVDAALNVALASYDPLTVGAKNASNDQLAQAVVDRLNERIGGSIEVQSFLITRIDFDDKTQARITAYQEEVGKTRTAQQAEQTASAQARANKALSESVSNDPNVLVSKCLDSLQEMVNKGQAVPPAFTCWPTDSSVVTTPTR